MLQKLTAVILCFCLLISGATVITTTAEEQVSSSLYEAARLFYAVAGMITLQPHEITLADVNNDGEFTLEDATAAFYLANGIKPAVRSLTFDAYLWQLTNAVSRTGSPNIISDPNAMSAFYRENIGFATMMWMPDIDYDTQAVLIIPLRRCNSYVSSVSADNTTVYVSLISLPSTPNIPYTAYAVIVVDRHAVMGKTVTVSSSYHTDTVSKRDLYGNYNCYNASNNPQRTYDVDTSPSGEATVYVSYTVPSTGYAITGMSYIATDDVVFVMCDLRVLAPDEYGFSILQTVSGSITMESGIYNNQDIVLCERISYPTDAVVGMPINHTVVYQSEEFQFPVDSSESTAQLITSYTELQTAYAAEQYGTPDYTTGFDDTYFQNRALILLKPVYHVLPYGVTLDGVGILDNTLHITVRFTNLDYYSPALYAGRLLIEVDAQYLSDIDTVVCHEEEAQIQTLPQQ